jgi:hypothetical protein
MAAVFSQLADENWPSVLFHQAWQTPREILGGSHAFAMVKPSKTKI